MALASIQSGTITGKLNGCDAGYDTEWFEDGVHVHAGRDLGRVRTLEQVGDPAGEFDVLEAAGHLAGGVAEHLAVLGRDGGRQVGAAAATRSRRRKSTAARALSDPAPHSAAASVGRLDRRIDLAGRGQRHARRLHAAGRVVDRPRAPRRPRDRLASDPVLEFSHGPILPSAVQRDRQQAACGPPAWPAPRRSSRSCSARSRRAARGLQRPRMKNTSTANTSMPIRQTVHQRFHSPGRSSAPARASARPPAGRRGSASTCPPGLDLGRLTGLPF